MSFISSIVQKAKDSVGLLILSAILGLVLGLGLRNCNPLSTPKIIEKDSTYINWIAVDSTYINWIAEDRKIENPVPSMVVANTNNKSGAIRTVTPNTKGRDLNCDCKCDSIRTYTGRIPVGDIGFVFYNLQAVGEITEMNFSNQIGVQNRIRIVKSEEYRSKETTIDNTPFVRVFAGAEINPQQLMRPSVFADAVLRKWTVGYRYEIGDIKPHNIKVGYKIFSL